jgi:hypothetical protein
LCRTIDSGVVRPPPRPFLFRYRLLPISTRRRARHPISMCHSRRSQFLCLRRPSSLDQAHLPNPNLACLLHVAVAVGVLDRQPTKGSTQSR